MIFFVVLIIAVVATFIFMKYYEPISLIVLIVGWIVSAIMILVIICQYVRTDSFIASSQKRYEILTYQLENDLYENDIVGKKELYNQIQDWNEDLAKYKVLQNNFWVGIFYPNIFNQFYFIDLSGDVQQSAQRSYAALTSGGDIVDID